MLRTANALPCQSINQFIQESLQACYLTMAVFITETIQGQMVKGRCTKVQKNPHQWIKVFVSFIRSQWEWDRPLSTG